VNSTERLDGSYGLMEVVVFIVVGLGTALLQPFQVRNETVELAEVLLESP
jgi:hypothetical protein